MKDWRKFLQSYWQMILTTVAIVILIIIVNAPSSSERLKGSSYSVEPQGYGAWYQRMIDKGVSIERWRKPAEEIFNQYPNGTTLLQVNSELQPFYLSPTEQKWIENGNTLVVLGLKAPVHDIEFSQNLSSPQGQVKIETTRRFQVDEEEAASYFRLPKIPENVVSDNMGAVVWKSSIGKGQVILATTPYLAANAYQDFPANYNLLTALATSDRQRIVVDEYLHGYRDAQDPNTKKAGATQKNLLTYFVDTPLLVAFVNLCLILGILIWQQNRRFGAVVIPQPPQIDNSSAYIQALGGVLRQAQSSEFVVQNIGKAEQLKLQQHLGLGNKQLVDRQTLVDTWQAQTKLPAADLPVILQLATGQQRLTEAELQQWLTQLQAMRDQLQRQSL
jgi:Domain of unknown function (DUF4350)